MDGLHLHPTRRTLTVATALACAAPALLADARGEAAAEDRVSQRRRAAAAIEPVRGCILRRDREARLGREQELHLRRALCERRLLEARGSGRGAGRAEGRADPGEHRSGGDCGGKGRAEAADRRLHRGRSGRQRLREVARPPRRQRHRAGVGTGFGYRRAHLSTHQGVRAGPEAARRPVRLRASGDQGVRRRRIAGRTPARRRLRGGRGDEARRIRSCLRLARQAERAGAGRARVAIRSCARS